MEPPHNNRKRKRKRKRKRESVSESESESDSEDVTYDFADRMGSEEDRARLREVVKRERIRAHIQYGQKGLVVRAQAVAADAKIAQTTYVFDILTAIARTQLFAARDMKPSGLTDEETQIDRDPWRRAEALRKQ